MTGSVAAYRDAVARLAGAAVEHDAAVRRARGAAEAENREAEVADGRLAERLTAARSALESGTTEATRLGLRPTADGADAMRSRDPLSLGEQLVERAADDLRRVREDAAAVAREEHRLAEAVATWETNAREDAARRAAEAERLRREREQAQARRDRTAGLLVAAALVLAVVLAVVGVAPAAAGVAVLALAGGLAYAVARARGDDVPTASTTTTDPRT